MAVGVTIFQGAIEFFGAVRSESYLAVIWLPVCVSFVCDLAAQMMPLLAHRYRVIIAAGHHETT